MSSNNWPPKFTLDGASILNLLTGDRFYSSADAAIREAVLNAIDAFGRQHISDTTISPEIEVIFDEQANTVTISDNGDGMDESDLRELFSKIGASASKIAQKNGEDQYKAVGEFGIGIVSYFLVSDKHQIHTLKLNGEPIGLEFDCSMLDAESAAKVVSSQRSSVGTTVILYIRDATLFESLLIRFPYWVRAVQGLHAKKVPTETNIAQGGLSTHIKTIEVETPEWIELAQLGPPSVFDVWDHLDGKGHVDILYRGVFVDHIEVKELWGIEGSIHVDPKEFKPKLNREGFVGEQLSGEVTRFLQKIHPQVLQAAVGCVQEVLSDRKTTEWTIRKWVTLWLAVPRSGPYKEAAKAWDEKFRKRKAFLLLKRDDTDLEVSVADIEDLNADRIYVAPTPLTSANDIVKQAVRVLRAKGLPVIQGTGREGGYLDFATMAARTTADLLINHFREVLPESVLIESVANDVVREEIIAEVFESLPKVRIVRLGSQAVPLVNVGEEIWINIEVAEGKKIIQEICDRNEGYLGVWVACLRHSPNYAGQIAKLLQNTPEAPVQLGLVRRQYLRGLAI